jgi:predicted RND superfamily exporter protein
VCLLAVMRLGGIKLNMVNLVAAPLLIGINIDYGIFLVSLARAAGNRGATRLELMEEIGTSCHAVLVCALTTVLGFGSLVFMAIPAVRSLGVAVSVGVTASLAATVLFLAPLLLRENQDASTALPPVAQAD